jgi:hypothetical protein
MKNYLYLVAEKLILAIVEFPYFHKKVTPSFLTLNIDWFTNCSWLDQLLAFKQIDRYLAFKI